MNHFFSFASIWVPHLHSRQSWHRCSLPSEKAKERAARSWWFNTISMIPKVACLFVRPSVRDICNNQIAIKLKRVDDTKEIGTVVQNPITKSSISSESRIEPISFGSTARSTLKVTVRQRLRAESE